MVASSKRRAPGREGVGGSLKEFGDPEIAACGFNAGAKGALVDIVELGATDEPALAVGSELVEEARRAPGTERLDKVDTLEAAIPGHIEELTVGASPVERPFSAEILMTPIKGCAGPVMPARPWPLDCGKSRTG